MKLFTTFAGAARARSIRNLPILRLLHDPEHRFIVLPSFGTKLMAVDPATGRTDGVMTFTTLSTTPDVDGMLAAQQNRIDKLVEAGRKAIDTGDVRDLDFLVCAAEDGVL